MRGPARPAPAWLWTTTLLVAMAFTIGRIAMAATLDLRTDEAYYWTWSQDLAWSYLDHPPMVAWFVRAGTALFGDTPFGARFTHLIAMTLIELIFADIARRRTGSHAAMLFVVLALESTINFGLTSAVIEPSIPMILFSGLLAWALCRLEESRNPAWWLLAGAAAGLALLSKFTAILFLPAVVAYLLSSRENRRWFGSPFLWAAALIAFAVFSPVLIWNASNEWASIRFQGGRVASTMTTDITGLLVYLANNLVLAGPFLSLLAVAGAVVALVRFHDGSDPVCLALAVAFLVPYGYLAERALHLNINPSWAIAMWPFGLTALAIVAFGEGSGRWGRGVVLVGALLGLPVAGALLFHAALNSGVWFGTRDLLGADAGYDVAAEEVLATARNEGATWIATSDYRTYAILRWHLWRELPVVQVTERSRFVGFASPDRGAIDGKPGLYVHQGGPSRLVRETIGTGEPLGDAVRVWRGTAMGAMQMELIEGWSPPLEPPRDSPFYHWPRHV